MSSRPHFDQDLAFIPAQLGLLIATDIRSRKRSPARRGAPRIPSFRKTCTRGTFRAMLLVILCFIPEVAAVLTRDTVEVAKEGKSGQSSSPTVIFAPPQRGHSAVVILHIVGCC